MVLLAAFLLFLGYLHGSAVAHIDENHMTLALNVSLETALFCFVFFMYLSYELFYKIRACSLEECLSAVPDGLPKAYGSQFLALLLLNAGITFLMALFNVGAYLSCGGGYPAYLLHILQNLLFNIFFCLRWEPRSGCLRRFISSACPLICSCLCSRFCRAPCLRPSFPPYRIWAAICILFTISSTSFRPI